jgi:L,D-transpeptidase catalytic domain
MSGYRPVAFSLGLAGLVVAGVSAPALAAKSKSETKKPAEQARALSGPLVAVVSLREQRVTVYDSHGQVARSPVSTGQSGHETPAGIFSVIGKEVEHYSNLYNDASMPYMQRITWSGVALHAGNLPGYAASHGCIRLPYDFSKRLFSMTKMGTRVIVARNDVSPVEFAHHKLFSPRPPVEAVAAAAPAETGSNGSSEPSPTPPMMLGGSAGAVARAVDTGVPVEVRKSAKSTAALKAETAAKAAEAVRAANAAAKNAGLAKAEAARASALAKKAEGIRLAAEQRLAGAARALATARTPEATQRAEAAKLAAEAKLAEVTPAAAAARMALAERQAEAAKAAEVQIAANAEKVATAAAAREAVRRAEPVSVFISRKTAKLYVRQGFEPLFETPVTILDPSAPIGTHVYTAVEQKGEGEPMRWHVVTVNGGSSERSSSEVKRGGKGSKPVEHIPSTSRAQSAAGALDRVEMPEEAVQKVSELLSPGSSLIVSDQPISHETGKGTDFVILTR